MKRLVLASVCALPLLTQSALAANWTGAYVGANVGYAWSDVEAHFDDDVNPFDLTDTDFDALGSDDADGAFAGATFGINQTFGNWLVGIEADVGLFGAQQLFTNAEPEANNVAIAGIPDCCADQFGSSIDVPFEGALTVDGGLYVLAALRAGYTFGKTLVYGKAGYGAADLGLEFETPCDNDCGYGRTEGMSQFVAVGAGVEHKLTENISIKVEYLHFDFDDEQLLSFREIGDEFDLFNLNVEAHTLKIGVNIQLDAFAE